MMSSPVTRRALLAGAGTAVASTALAIPYVNAAHATEVCSLPLEPICDKVERLSHELSEVLGGYCNGQFRAIIGPGDDIILQNVRVRPVRSPDRRLRAAASEIKAAMAEMGCDDYMVFVKHWSGEHTATAIEFLSPDCKTSRSYPLA